MKPKIYSNDNWYNIHAEEIINISHQIDIEVNNQKPNFQTRSIDQYYLLLVIKKKFKVSNYVPILQASLISRKLGLYKIKKAK